jgi:hypothetical protein
VEFGEYHKEIPNRLNVCSHSVREVTLRMLQCLITYTLDKKDAKYIQNFDEDIFQNGYLEA